VYGLSNFASTRQRTASRGRFLLALLLAGAALLGASFGLLLGSPLPAAAARSATPCANANLRPTPSDIHAVDTAIVCLIDGVRRSAHLPPLRPNRSLHHVAAGQSVEMVLGNYFGDNSRSGQTPLQRIVATRYPKVATRYPKRTTPVATAQNIAWGTDSQATPAAIVAAWMASPPHRQIMLTAGFRDIGVGAAPSAPSALAAGQPGATYTVEFGARLR
jgi:uncharacterized protein YkwD